MPTTNFGKDIRDRPQRLSANSEMYFMVGPPVAPASLPTVALYARSLEFTLDARINRLPDVPLASLKEQFFAFDDMIAVARLKELVLSRGR